MTRERQLTSFVQTSSTVHFIISRFSWVIWNLKPIAKSLVLGSLCDEVNAPYVTTHS